METHPQFHQVWNYLLWVEERGITLPQIAESQLSYAEKAAPPLEAEPFPSKTYKSKMFIYSDNLNDDEAAMLHRILDAIQVSRDDFHEVHYLNEEPQGSIHSQAVLSPFVLLVGSETSKQWAEDSLRPLSPLNKIMQNNEQVVLSIPHPRLMLSTPQLKIDAWHGLKEFRLLFEQSNYISEK